MDLWLQTIVLGLVQGLTEYLPISSTGHIRVAAVFMGIPDPGAAFSAVTQVGTALAVGFYFRTDLANIFNGLFRSKTKSDLLLLRFMAIATFPIVLVGLLFANFFETTARDLRLVAFALIFFGVLLYLSDRIRPQNLNISELNYKKSLLIGLAQVLALVPGVSRSGITMTMGRWLGFNRVSAARISFLLSLPAIFLSAIYQLQHLGEESVFNWTHTIVASVISFITGYITIEFILRWLTKHSFAVFALYRIVLGFILFAGMIWLNVSPVG